MNPTTPPRPVNTASTPVLATSTPASSSSAPSSSRLMPNLTKLARPTTPLVPAEPSPDLTPTSSYRSKTIRFVSRGSREVFRRSGLATLTGLFPSPPGDDPDPSSSSGSGPIISASSLGATPTRTHQQQQSTFLTLDTSRILYPTLRQHPAPTEHPVLVVSLAQIAGISPMINNDELFDTLMRKLEPWVGEEGQGGYVLVVLAADDDAGAAGRRWPGVGWWVWKWKRIPRKYRKNMKRLYIVHPSLFTRTLLPFLLPLLSPKSYGKLHPLSSLLALSHTYGVPLTNIDITLPVLQQEAALLRDRPDLVPARCRVNHTRPKLDERGSWTGTISSSIVYATSYLPFSSYLSEENEKASPDEPRGLWGRSAEAIIQDNGGKMPRSMLSLREAILAHCIETEGIFRRSSNSTLLGPIIALLDLPIPDQPNLPWNDIAKHDPLVPPKMILRFLAEMAEPLIPSNLYPSIRETTTPEQMEQSFIPSLPPSTRIILEFVVELLADLSLYEAETKMTPLAYSIVLAPTLIRGDDPLEDAELCMVPGKKLPRGFRADFGGARASEEGKEAKEAKQAKDAVEGQGGEVGEGTLVGVLKMWITSKQAVKV